MTYRCQLIHTATFAFLLLLPLGAEAQTPGHAPAGPSARPQAEHNRPFAPLTSREEQYLDQILNYWEASSSRIERFRCNFKQWEYDPVFGPSQQPKRYTEGIIKYAAPDKGLYRETKGTQWNRPEKEGERPSYTPLPQSDLKHWVCDGESMYEMNHQERTMVQYELPPEKRGKAIVDGPLPFLFGAQKDAIKNRYWVRVVTPPDAEEEFHLEAYPKLQRDAANYKKVIVIIDREDFLPKGLVIFAVNYGPNNHSRTSFTFENREVNWSEPLERLRFWERAFYQPSLPSGWKKIVRRHDEWTDDEPAATGPTRQSRHPTSTGRR